MAGYILIITSPRNEMGHISFVTSVQVEGALFARPQYLPLRKIIRLKLAIRV